jgi:release factor glutamine methyltransferase
MNTWKDVQLYIQNAASQFFDPLEAEAISYVWLNDAMGVDKCRILLREKVILEPYQIELINNATEKLKKGFPIQYIIGYVNFLGCKIAVNEDVLIPRPETEQLTMLAYDLIKEVETPKIIDVCTGSGCIAIALSKKNIYSNVWATDCSISALNVAQKNAQLNNADVNFYVSDVLNESFIGDSYDLVISNPPYIDEDEKKNISPHILNFEPSIALFAPKYNPLIFYESIASEAFKKLKFNGILAFEINQKYGDEVCSLLIQKNYRDVTLLKDYNNFNRFVFAKK